MSAQQKALFLLEPHGEFVVQSNDIPEPGPGEVLVEIQASALNPIDWKIQALNIFVTKYPVVLGSDAASIVRKVGADVTGIAVGDRIFHKGSRDDLHRYASHQQYAIVAAEFVAKIPSHLTFDQAAVVPSAAVTAAIGLYGPTGQPSGGFGLTAPWDGGKGKYAGQPIVVVAGSTSVGQQMIQFSKLSGFSPIITTASKGNEAYLKSLGATHVIDRNVALSSAVKEITSEPIKFICDAVSLEDTQLAAYETLAPGGVLLLVFPLALDKSKLSNEKVVTMVVSDYGSEGKRKVAVALFNNLPALLEAGEIKPNNVEVLQGGLAAIPEGLERLKSGKVSSAKLVVHPQETV